NVLLGEKYKHLLKGQVIVDADQAGIKPISTPRGVHFEKDSLLIDPLTAIVIRISILASLLALVGLSLKRNRHLK
ncbi:hypothetical protein, partial [Listeria monocytogenes]|uniref:hypothetical protein n=1 Tax=Listeria monocytogenes TaxID=1639 RepID=UPI000AD5F6DA